MRNVAIVYDRINKWGGAERVLLALHEMFPGAPLYTAVYDAKKAPWAKVFPKIYTSFLQKIPFAKNNHEFLGTFMPIAFEGKFSSKGRPAPDWDEYDLVISVTSEAAKGIITKPGTFHLCYCLTPTRYLWSGYNFYFKNPILRFLAGPAVSYLRNWEKVAAQRPDLMVAISTEVKKRIKKYYNRDSEIIFPPVNLYFDLRRKNSFLRVSHSTYGKNRKYYLVVSRLVPYKRVDLVVEAFNKLGKKLVIVGSGSQAGNLKRKACNNIKFVGEVSEKELAKLYLGAKALIMPQEEDFGIISPEAQSFGVGVIAYKKGGALDSVVDGKTGVFFDKQNVDSLLEAIAKFEKMSFNHIYLINNAKAFAKEKFKRELQKTLIRAFDSRRRGNQALA